MRNGKYELITAPEEYPGRLYRGKYCYEHIYVWWLNTKEIPDNKEVIHHINNQKRDNRIENLTKLSISEHGSLHNQVNTKPNTKCSHCNKEFKVRPWKLKRKYTFCSRKCVGLFGFYRKKAQRL